MSAVMLQPFVQKGRQNAGPITMAESRENLTVLLVDVCDSTRLYESMGDEAKRISRSASSMSPELETAVTKVHAELSNLKHQIGRAHV